MFQIEQINQAKGDSQSSRLSESDGGWLPNDRTSRHEISTPGSIKGVSVIVSPVRGCQNDPCSISLQSQLLILPKGTVLRLIEILPKGEPAPNTKLNSETVIERCKFSNGRILVDSAEIKEWIEGPQVVKVPFTKRYSGAVLALTGSAKLFAPRGELEEVRQRQKVSLLYPDGANQQLMTLDIIIKANSIAVGIRK